MSFGCKVWRADGSEITLDPSDKMARIYDIVTVQNPAIGTGLPSDWTWYAYPGMQDDGHWSVRGYARFAFGLFAKLGVGGFYYKFQTPGQNSSFGIPEGWVTVINF